jgi:hypothetical protein
MADFATAGAAMGSGGGSLSVRTAIRIAWVAWMFLLVIPFVTFLAFLITLANYESSTLAHHDGTWLIGSSIYLLIAVPISFFWRSRVFKAYWTGQTISPGKYLFGSISTWLALEIGGIISLVGCFVDHSLLPNLLPALVAFMFYVTLWPSGRAMVRNVGSHEDPQLYEEPR